MALNTPPCKGHCWAQEEGVQEMRALARQHLPCRWVGTGVWGTRHEKEVASGSLCSPPSSISAPPPAGGAPPLTACPIFSSHSLMRDLSLGIP